MSNAEILSAAAHEAGHFVFAASQQQTPDCLAMEWNAARSFWQGKTQLPSIGHLSLEVQFPILFGFSFSGCFAQVKHAMELLDSEATVPWSDVCRWVEREPRKPLELPLRRGQTFVVPTAWFDERDADTFQHNAGVAMYGLPDWESYEKYLVQACRLAVDVMEDASSWDKIERLAVKLASSIRQQRAMLESAAAWPR
ncbi:MAG TPA: hypothetical protein PKC18_03945 [Lacipirellulaceae bacterium]|nr:hypothetical protein [Lacipirellulaceae bacterium]